MAPSVATATTAWLGELFGFIRGRARTLRVRLRGVWGPGSLLHIIVLVLMPRARCASRCGRLCVRNSKLRFALRRAKCSRCHQQQVLSMMMFHFEADARASVANGGAKSTLSAAAKPARPSPPVWRGLRRQAPCTQPLLGWPAVA